MTWLRHALVSLAVAGVLAAIASGSARAAVLLDQVSAGTFNSVAGLSNGSTFGRSQTFTVGLAGILDSVEVSFFPPSGAPTTLRILATSGGVPIGGAAGSTVLATSTLVTGVGGVFTFDLSPSALAVAVGDVLAIEPFGSGSWLGTSTNPYAPGSDHFFSAPSPNTWTVNSGSDNFFRTFVQVAQVPEPASLTLFAAGLAALGLIGWRRRRAA